MIRVKNRAPSRTVYTVLAALLPFLFVLAGNALGDVKNNPLAKAVVSGIGGEKVAAGSPRADPAKPAAEKKNPEATKAGETKRFDLGAFSFTSEKRRDPFEPVYLSRLRNERAMRASVGKRGTGYELEELKFVGTLKTGTQRSAMMEDRQGKGMLFRKGDYLNNNLWVFDILDDKMVLGYKLRNEVRKITIDIPKK